MQTLVLNDETNMQQWVPRNRAQRRSKKGGRNLFLKIQAMRKWLQRKGITVGRAETVPTGKHATGYYGELVQLFRKANK